MLEEGHKVEGSVVADVRVYGMVADGILDGTALEKATVLPHPDNEGVLQRKRKQREKGKGKERQNDEGGI